VPAAYDVFMSYRHSRAADARRLRDVLQARDLRVWFDETDIPDFAGITAQAREGIAAAKVLLAYYSADYPESRACQWELTQAFLAAQRAGDPRDRVLVVNPEAAPDHIEPVELRDAKYLAAPEADSEFEMVGAAVAHHVQALIGPLGEVAPDRPRWLPGQAVSAPRFVGRLGEMWRIHSALSPEEAGMTAGVSGPGAAFVTGLGGIGKSLLAAEYALRFGAAYPDGVFWLRVSAPRQAGVGGPDALLDDTGRQLRGFGAALGIPVLGVDLDEVRGSLAGAIERRGEPCLWIVDDLPADVGVDALRGLFAPHPLAKTLVTTCSREYAGLAPQVDLDGLPREDAYALLTAQRLPDDPADERAARALVEDLGCHPQALDVTGAGLKADAGLRSFADYRNGLANPTRDELELVSELAHVLPTGHERSVALTLARSIDRLAEPGRDLLRLASVFTARPIPRRFVADVFAEADGLGADEALRRTARAGQGAEKHSLADTAEGDRAWQVHSLVSRTVHFKEPSTRREELRGAAVRTLMRHLHAPGLGPPAFSTAEALARELTAGVRDKAEADLLREVARLDWRRGDYVRARVELLTARGGYIMSFGKDHPDTISALLDLFRLAQSAHEPHRGLPWLMEAIDCRRRTLGDSHPDTLELLITYAGVRYTQTDLPAARSLLERVIHESTRAIGEDHPVTLRAQYWLSLVTAEAGELASAIEGHERTLAARRRVLGDSHDETLASLATLAETLLVAGDGAGASSRRQEVVDICRRTFGDDHPSTLKAISDLSHTLARNGQLDTATAELEDVLIAYRRQLGDDHLITLLTLGNLAENLAASGNHARARALWDEEFTGYRRILGDDVPGWAQPDLKAIKFLYEHDEIHQARAAYQALLARQPRKLPAGQPDYLS
jgi:hypothetical protein